MPNYSIAKNRIRASELDIVHTVESAQPLTFHADYDFANGSLEYATNFAVTRAKFKGGPANATVELESSDGAREFAQRFRLGDDMGEIYQHISTDASMDAAIKRYRGMRVTLNDPWETTLCFIMSQFNNVKRIRLIIRRFIDEFGTPINDGNGGPARKSFPTSARLTEFSEKDFRRCGAGFRAKYIASAAEFCTNNMDLYGLTGKSYDNVKASLMEISGVGDKVADCIALMGYGKMEAFPIDVWVKRTLERIYFKGEKKRPAELHDFADERWSNWRGYAQQYLFHYARNNSLYGAKDRKLV
jgi:N-glycosylase/DNA lyase